MCVMTELSEETGLPELQCSECEVIFSVVFRRALDVEGIEFCPFCGSEIERNVRAL